MVSICPRDFGLTTLLLRIDPKSDLRSNKRRMTRTATLDGGVAVSDGGWSDGDRTFPIAVAKSHSTRAMASAVEVLKSGHERVTVATNEGVFEAVLQSYRLSPTIRLTLAITANLCKQEVQPVAPAEPSEPSEPSAAVIVLKWGQSAGDYPFPAEFSTDSNGTAISVGSMGWCLLTSDGLVLANTADDWGDPISVPAELSDGSTVFTQASMGLDHALALKNTGEVIGWGDDSSGQVTIPVEAQSGVVYIMAGYYNSWAIKDTGELIGWGDSWHSSTMPAAASSGMAAVASDGSCTVALTDAGEVIAIGGSNSRGQLTIPVEAQSGIIAISAGDSHVLALKDTGEVIGWGDNTYGQTTIPAEAQSGIVSIEAGNDSSYAITDAGAVVVWGENAGETMPSGAGSGVFDIGSTGYLTIALKEI